MPKSIDINSLLKATGNEYATVVGKKGVYTDAQFPPYDTGSMTLNCLLGGQTDSGMPSNKITALAGEQGVGKTYFALSIAKEFLDMHPEGIFVYAGTEGATTKEMLAERVGHLDRIIVLPVATVQAISTQLSNLLTWWEKQRKKDPDGKMLVVLDSLGNLSTTKEVTDIEKGNETKDMTRAQLLKGTFRALTTCRNGKRRVLEVFDSEIECTKLNYRFVTQHGAEKLVKVYRNSQWQSVKKLIIGTK